MATPTYTPPPAVAPEDVERVHPVSIGMHALANNRDYVAADAVGKVGAAELLLSTTSRLGAWRGYEMLAGWPVDYGEVADADAMLALHDWADDPHARTVYHYVAPGDSCTRADDPGYRWVCMSGHGTAVEHWERRPLVAPIADLEARAAELEVELAGKIGSSALDGYAPLDSPVFAGTPTAPTPSSTDASTRIATTAFVAAAVVAGGGGAALVAIPSVQMWYGAGVTAPLGPAGAAATSGDCCLWPDASRRCRVARSESRYRPSIVSDGAGLYGIRSAAGSYQHLAIDALSTYSSGIIGDHTLYMRLRRGSAASGYALFFGSAESARLALYGNSEGSGDAMGYFAGATTSVWPAYIVTTAIQLIEIRVRSGVATLYVDGAVVAAGSAPLTVASGTWTPRIGCYAPGGVTQSCDVDVFAVVLLDGTATTSECDAIRAALMPE